MTEPAAQGATTQANRRGGRAFLIDNVVVFGAQLINTLRGILLLPLLVKGLGTAAFGVWSQSLAFATFATAVLGLNIHQSLVRFMADEKTKSGATYATLLGAATAISGAGCALLFFVMPDAGVRLLVGENDRTLFALALALVVTTTVRLLNLNLYRATDRLLARSAIDLSSSFIELGLIVVAVASGGSLHDALAVSVAASFVTAIVTSLHGMRLTWPLGYDRAVLAEALRYGAFLVPASMGILLLDRGDRFIISHALGSEAVGVYQAHYTLGGAASLILAPIQTTLIPKVIALWANDKDGARRYIETSYRILAIASFILVALLAALAPPLLHILANPEIAAGSSLNVLLIGTGATLWGLSVVAQMPLFAAKRTSIIGVATFLAALLNLALNLLLVPRFGITAAAGATAITYAITLAAFVITGGRELPVSWHLPSLLRAAICAALVGGLAWLCAPRNVVALALVGILATLTYGLLLILLRAIPTEERNALLKRLRLREGNADKSPPR
jgi:O-antigen/teichoic acid export membrane protein